MPTTERLPLQIVRYANEDEARIELVDPFDTSETTIESSPPPESIDPLLGELTQDYTADF